MISLLTFSLVSAGLVYLAGRGDNARDPRLTVLLLFLLATYPLLAAALPKIAIIPAAESVAGGEAGFPWVKILLLVWALGFLIEMSRLLRAWTGLRRWRKRSVLVDRVEGVEIRALAGLRGPVAAGVRRPVVLVPTSWPVLQEQSRRVVLAHELAHHRRRDPLWRLIAGVACAVHWYHPLVRWMARRFVMQCEFACDAAVLRQGVDAKSYARVLCDFSGERSSPLILAMAESSSLETRVKRMLKPASPRGGKLALALACVGILAAGALAMVERKPQASHSVPDGEVQLRLTANPFPGEP